MNACSRLLSFLPRVLVQFTGHCAHCDQLSQRVWYDTGFSAHVVRAFQPLLVPQTWALVLELPLPTSLLDASWSFVRRQSWSAHSRRHILDLLHGTDYFAFHGVALVLHVWTSASTFLASSWTFVLLLSNSSVASPSSLCSRFA